MPDIYCSHCQQTKTAEAFAPSQQKSGAWCRDCYRSWYVDRSGGLVQRSCDQCGAEMSCTGRRASEPSVFCSRACKDRHRKDRDISARLAAKAEMPSRRCPHCGDELTPRHRADAVFCSERCNQAAHNATRKASWKVGSRQERVSRAYIVERDGSRCHLCGKHCCADEIHLDHVIPLARGGSHSPENIRVACAPCNLSKRDRARGEQLLLVG